MKKFFLMVAVAMMIATNVNAQVGYDDTKQEVAVSIGGFSNSTWMSIAEDMGTAIASFGTASYDDGKFIGPISAEYFYHLDSKWGVGVIGVFTQETKDMFSQKVKIGEAKNGYYTVMPAAKFNWLRKKNFGMYTKLGAGITFLTQKEEMTSSDHEDRSESSVCFNFQASLLGLEFGAPYLRGFLELGVGEQGLALIGVRCKF